MDRISRHSWGRGVASLLFVNDVVLMALSGCDLQHLLGWSWSALTWLTKCEVVGMRVSTTKYKAVVLSQKKVNSPLWVGSDLLPQVEGFKYLGVLFTSEDRLEQEFDRYRSSSNASVGLDRCGRRLKRSIHQLICVPTLTYGHELWVVTERTRL